MLADARYCNGLALSYLRFSDPRQAAGNSEDRQELNAENLCKMAGLTLMADHEYVDRGRSGFKGNRQQSLDALLKTLKSGAIPEKTTLIVEQIDRLSRKGIDSTQALISKIFSYEINIMISIPQHQIYYAAKREEDIGATIQLAMYAYSAWLYSKNLSDRILAVNAARRKRKKNGESVLLSSVYPAWLVHAGNGKFNVKPGAAKTIKHIYSRVIAGTGCNAIQKELNSQPDKYPTLGRSNSWSQRAIANIVQGRQVLGEITTKDDDVYPNYYPKIIDEKTHFQANTAMAGRRIHRVAQTKHLNIFKTLLYSANDDCLMHQYTTQSPRKDAATVVEKRYKSANARKHIKGSCTASVNATRLEDMIFELLPKLQLTPSKTDVRKKLLDQETYWQDEIAFMQNEISDGSQSARALKKPLSVAVTKLAGIQEKLATMVGKAAVPTKSNRMKLSKMKRGTSQEREAVRDAVSAIVSRIEVYLLKMGTQRRDAVKVIVEITFRNGDRIRAIEVNKTLVKLSLVGGKSLSEQCQAGKRYTKKDYDKVVKLIAKIK